MSTGSVAVAEVVFGAFVGLGVWFAGRWVLRVLAALLWTVNGGHAHTTLTAAPRGTSTIVPSHVDHNRKMRDTSDHKI